MSANFQFHESFGVEDAVHLREDLGRIGPHTAVVIDLSDVRYVTEAAIEALIATLQSIARRGTRRIFGVGFEGVGLEEFRAIGVVC